METETAILDLVVVTGFDDWRCDVCSWPLAATIWEGCTLGNCSQRGEQWERSIETNRVWIDAKKALRHLVSEARRMKSVRRAAEAYRLDPVDNRDRPASWELLHALVSAASEPAGTNGGR